MSTPDYVLNEVFTWLEGQERQTLQAGTFVRPVEPQYVPKHVKDDPRWRHFTSHAYLFCWCSRGFVMVPREFVRKA